MLGKIVKVLAGALFLFLGAGSLFGIFEPETRLTDRLIPSAIFIGLSLIFFYPLIEKYIKKGKSYGSKNSTPNIEKNTYILNVLNKYNISPAYLFIPFILFIFLPIIWSRAPTYQYSTSLLLLLWGIVFPFFAILWKELFKLNFKNAFNFNKIILSGFFSIYLLFYIDIAMNYINVKKHNIEVTILSVLSDPYNKYANLGRCESRVSVKNNENYRDDFCVDNIESDNLTHGDIAYSNNNNATLSLRVSWLGSVVDTIYWHNK